MPAISAGRARAATAGPSRSSPLQRLGAGHDRLKAAGDRDLQVGGDSSPLLLRGVARGLRAIARPPGGPIDELALQQSLLAGPAPEQQRNGDRHEGQQRLPRRPRRRIERHPRHGDQRRDADRPGKPPAVGCRPARAVEQQRQDDDRGHRGTDEQPAQRRLRRQHDSDRGERRQRRSPRPGHGQRHRRDCNGAHQPLAGTGRREQHLELTRRGEQGRTPEQPAREHTVTVLPAVGAVLVRADEVNLLPEDEIAARPVRANETRFRTAADDAAGDEPHSEGMPHAASPRSPAASPPPGATQRIRIRLRPRARRALLTVHIITGVGLLGSVAGVLAVNIRAAGTSDAELAAASYELLAMFTLLFGIPLSLASLATGILLGLSSAWGVLRFAWVASKLGLLLGVILVGAFVLGPGTDAMRSGQGGAEARLIAGSIYDVAALTLATGLSMFKPRRRRRVAP